MKINIYYGGRGLIDDPTLYVINKMEEVFRELRVTVERFQKFYYYITTDIKRCRWNYSCNDCGMAWHWWLYAAIFGCMLVIWK